MKDFSLKMWNSWTEAEIAKIREGIAAGLSAANISLGIFGRTRSAVIGFCNRNGLKLTGRSRIDQDPGEMVRRRRERARKQYLLKSPERRAHLQPGEVPVPLNLSIMELDEGSCRWPYGEERPYRFCGHLIHHNAYCLYHTVMSVRPAREQAR